MAASVQKLEQQHGTYFFDTEDQLHGLCRDSLDYRRHDGHRRPVLPRPIPSPRRACYAGSIPPNIQELVSKMAQSSISAGELALGGIAETDPIPKKGMLCSQHRSRS